MKRKRASASGRAVGVVLLLLVCLPAAARTHGRSHGGIRVTRIEHQVTGDRVRVVVRFDAAVQYVAGTATDPFRIFFDLRGTHPAAALAASALVGDTLVQRIRVAQYQPGITRMVLDLARPAPYTATFLSNPPRLVVEVLRSGAAPARIVKEAHKISQPAPSALSIPTPVAPALVPEQMPPSPPQVTYANGLLTIVASNSTLSDILQAVAARTGATLDAPPSLTAQRVAVRLGPARPLDVVADLLAGLDYIVVGASNDPEAIRNIILSPTTSSSLPEPAGRHAVAKYQPPPPEETEAPAPEPSPPASEAQTPATPAAQSPPPVKTPAELLEELRKLQEQQQQQSQEPAKEPQR
ncbi:MAG: AMIN domain-containing protein [Terriglobales bacterium]